VALNLGELFGTIGLDASEWDRKLKGAQGSLKAFGVAGAALAATAAVAIGAALTKGITESMDIEKGTDMIQAQLGLTEAQAGTAGKAAGSLFAKNYGESMDEVQGAVAAVMSSVKGMRNASDADVEAMTGKMMNLSKVMGIDVARAAQVAGQMIASGIATDGTHAADLLTASLQKVPQNVRGDILDAVDEYGPFMKNLGIVGEEAMGLLVRSSAKGMYGIDKTGDAIKEFGIRATDMTKATGAAYEALGLDQEAMSAKLLAGGDASKAAFNDIIQGLTGMDDPVAQSQAALALFGTPLEDLSVTEIPAFLNALDPMGDKFDSVAGAADQLGKDLNSNATAGFDGFKRQAEAALITFVQGNIMPSVSQFAGFLNNTAGPAVTQFAGWITSDALPALRGFGDWFTQNLPAIQGWATVIGVLLIPLFIRIGVSAAASAAAQVVAWTMAGGGAIKTAAIYVATSYAMIGRFIAMSAAASVNAAIVVGGWVLMGAQALIQAARMAAAWIIAMGPVGWIIAAVVGLVALIIANWEAIAKFTSEAWANVSKVLTDFGSNTLGMFADFFTNTGGMFVDFFTNTVGMVSDFIANMTAPFQAGFQVVQTIFSTAWEVIQTYVATALAVLIALFTGQFDKIPAYLASAWDKISGFFLSGVQAIDQILGGGITAAVNFVMGIFNGLVAWVAGIPQMFMDGLAAIGQLYLTVGMWILSVKDAAVSKFMEIVAWVQSVPQMILDGLNMLGQLYLQVGLWILSVKDAAVAKFMEMVEWVKGIPGMVLAGLGAIADLQVTVGTWILGVKDAAVAKFLDLVAWVGGLPQRILDALGNLGNLLVNAGGQILDGFLRGLQDGFKGVQDFVGGIGQWIADHKGPKAYDLALLVPAGGWIMSGLQKGIEASMPALQKTLGGVSATIAGGVNGGTVGLTSTAPAATSPAATGANDQAAKTIIYVTIEGEKNPEGTWQVFKSRLNESLRGQNSEIVIN
jgi:phage-related protein